MLDYARPREKRPEGTPFYVRVIAVGFSIMAIVVGTLFGVLSIATAIDQIKRYQTIIESDVIRFFLASIILLMSGVVGIYCSRRFRR